MSTPDKNANTHAIHQRTSLFIDRSALITLAFFIRQEANLAAWLEAISLFSPVVYEHTGMSAIQVFLDSKPELADRLCAIPSNTPLAIDDEEAQAVNETIACWLTSPRIQASLQRFDVEKGGPRHSHQETLGYLVRMLLRARQYNADLLVWSPRFRLILSVFQEAGIELHRDIPRGPLSRSAAAREGFPWYPPRSLAEAEHRFTFLHDEATTHRPSPIESPRLSPRPSTSSAWGTEDKRLDGVTVFICYSRKDAVFRDQLRGALVPYERKGELRVWADELIEPGQTWEAEIVRRLDEARIVIPLLSNDFFASDYCFEKELPRAQARRSKGECEIIPVVVRACRYEKTEVGLLQAIVPGGKPVDEHPKHDVAWLEVTMQLDRTLARVGRR